MIYHKVLYRSDEGWVYEVCQVVARGTVAGSLEMAERAAEMHMETIKRTEEKSEVSTTEKDEFAQLLRSMLELMEGRKYARENPTPDNRNDPS